MIENKFPTTNFKLQTTPDDQTYTNKSLKCMLSKFVNCLGFWILERGILPSNSEVVLCVV
jgi:hypothetical protein